MTLRTVLWALAALAFSGLPAAADDDYAAARDEMLRVIELHARHAQSETRIEALDKRVLAAMGRVPRHAFVPPEIARYAYLDTPLPLGHEQNISQPFIIALMTHLLDVQPGDRVFETGTGAGYHAAVLAELSARVYSVEVIEPLAMSAARRLDELDYGTVETRMGDGYFGWPAQAPFDKILLKEAVDHLPPALLRQLKPGGKLVAPIGPLKDVQFLTVVEKLPDGTLGQRRVLEVRFSPLQGGDRI